MEVMIGMWSEELSESIRVIPVISNVEIMWSMAFFPFLALLVAPAFLEI